MIHAHAKFAPLDFINKRMKEKRRLFYPNRKSPLQKEQKDKKVPKIAN